MHITTGTTGIIKRSKTAELFNRTPRTLARWEALGILTPIKLNCRSVAYPAAQVERILRGEVHAASGLSPSQPAQRSKAGTFTRRAQALS
ncbi:MAG TPA: hypothetical protein PKI20_09095 [Verrucomicrobiota bacterium]|jgi:hypothetical protein|nr:hypothetical protein [Verrucomicrobiota bacterium]